MADKNASAERVRALSVEYLNRSGMSPVDFARRIDYAASYVRAFLNGTYRGLSGREIEIEKICGAILSFIEANPLGMDSFVANAIYETSTVKALRKVFHELMDRPQVYLVYAPPGSGKTDVARHLIAQHNAAHGKKDKQFIFRVYCRARITPRDLLRRVSAACGAQADISVDRAIHNLRWDYRGARVVLYFDEAQHLDIPCFETVRELLDEEPRMSLCFAGSHELDTMFARWAGSIEQLERRITDKVTLPPVTTDEAEGILRSELKAAPPDAATIREQIELAHITLKLEKLTTRYLSIGRLMANIRSIREAMAITNGNGNGGHK